MIADSPRWNDMKEPRRSGFNCIFRLPHFTYRQTFTTFNSIQSLGMPEHTKYNQFQFAKPKKSKR